MKNQNIHLTFNKFHLLCCVLTFRVDKNMVILVCLLSNALCITILPVLHRFPGMVMLVFWYGVFLGAPDTLSNVMLIKVFGKEVSVFWRVYKVDMTSWIFFNTKIFNISSELYRYQNTWCKLFTSWNKKILIYSLKNVPQQNIYSNSAEKRDPIRAINTFSK